VHYCAVLCGCNCILIPAGIPARRARAFLQFIVRMPPPPWQVPPGAVRTPASPRNVTYIRPLCMGVHYALSAFERAERAYDTPGADFSIAMGAKCGNASRENSARTQKKCSWERLWVVKGSWRWRETLLAYTTSLHP